MIRWLSPIHLAIQAEVEQAMAFTPVERPVIVSGSPWLLLSFDPATTQAFFWELITVSLFFLVIYRTLRSPNQVERVIWTMTLTGASLAVLGMAQRAAGNGRLLWFRPLPHGGDPFGPYVNRTHFAGLMLIILPVALGYFLSRSDRTTRNLSWIDYLIRMRPGEAMRRILLPFLTLIMAAALLISRSRGALVSFVAALFLIVLWLAIRRSERRAAWHAAGFTAGAFLFTLWIAADILLGTMERLAAELTDLSGSLRINLWREAFGLWSRFPLVGTGWAPLKSPFHWSGPSSPDL